MHDGPIWRNERLVDREEEERQPLRLGGVRFGAYEHEDPVRLTVIVLSSRGEQSALLRDLVHTQPELLEEDWDFSKHTNHEAGIEAIERVRSWLPAKDIPSRRPTSQDRAGGG